MIFMFWTGSMLEEPPAASAWRARFHDEFRVFGVEDVLRILRSEEQKDCFTKIRIPACQSDIARLVLLREYGGLYIDGHTGPGAAEALSKTFLLLAQYELILFREGWKDDYGFYGNSFMVARRGASVLDVVIETAFKNLLRHKAEEDTVAHYIPYNIFYLTGSPVFIDCFYDQGDQSAWKSAWDVKPEFGDRILVRVRETEGTDIGIWPWSFYHYRHWGLHWTERQQRESLFHDRLIEAS